MRSYDGAGRLGLLVPGTYSPSFVSGSVKEEVFDILRCSTNTRVAARARVRMRFMCRLDDQVAIMMLGLLEVGKLLGMRIWVEVRDASAGYGGCL